MSLIIRVSLKTLIDTGRGDLLSGEMGLAGQFDLSTKQKMLIQVIQIFFSLCSLLWWRVVSNQPTLKIYL